MSRIEDILSLQPWQAYERAMFNDLYYKFRPPRYLVKPDLRDVIGKLSLKKRQIDVAVFDTEDAQRPCLVVECKRYRRKLDVSDVGEFITRVEDLGASQGLVACPKGFSTAAQNLARAKRLRTCTLTLSEADRLNWREIARAVYPWDEGFHPAMGDALYTLDSSDSVDDTIDRLEDLPFEEWEATVLALAQINADRAARLLHTIAQFHFDDAWRFNAVRLLDELRWMTPGLHEQLLQVERDPETLALLRDRL